MIQLSLSRNCLPLLILYAALVLADQRPANAQRDDEGPVVIGGLHVAEATAVEVGFGFGHRDRIDRHVRAYFGGGFGLSAEAVLVEDPVYGVRLGAWFNYLISLGLGTGYYWNSEGGTVVLQPEIGVGFNEARISWRFSIPFATMPKGMGLSDLTIGISLML